MIVHSQHGRPALKSFNANPSTSSKLLRVIIARFATHILPPQVSQTRYSTRHRADCFLIQTIIIPIRVLVDLEVSQFPGMKYILGRCAVMVVLSFAEQIVKRILKDDMFQLG